VGIRADVVMRIATLDGVQPSALSELDDIMEKQFAGKSTGKTSSLGGAKAAADIVNFLDASIEGAVMDQIARADEALGSKIQDLIFVFDNLSTSTTAACRSCCATCRATACSWP
jgi:flagellar motor switch protein FliG